MGRQCIKMEISEIGSRAGQWLQDLGKNALRIQISKIQDFCVDLLQENDTGRQTERAIEIIIVLLGLVSLDKLDVDYLLRSKMFEKEASCWELGEDGVYRRKDLVTMSPSSGTRKCDELGRKSGEKKNSESIS